MDKYFSNLPPGYTSNYFFEFSGGCVTYRKLGSTPDAEATTVTMARRIPDLESSIVLDLFGKAGTKHLRMMDLTLPKNAGKVLAKKKVDSLSKKYFSIPDKFLKFYPKSNSLQKHKESSKIVKKKILIKRPGIPGTDNVVVKRRRVGRPPKPLEPVTGAQSITKFFRVNKD